MNPFLFERARPGHDAPLRVVLLPPAYGGQDDFLHHGFAGAVRERHLDVDLVFAELQLQHVNDRDALSRLQQEIILPARALGCAVWLGGISLGAYIALCYAERRHDELDGLCLFAPYLGTHLVTDEIGRVAGLDNWQPGELVEDDEERRVWRFIKTLRSGVLPVSLGLGSEDRFAGRQRLMAAALASADVDVVPGEHDWPTWRRLWERFLDGKLAIRAKRR
jgi:pimeloyl-ACP methyl ester carboxylesterase